MARQWREDRVTGLAAEVAFFAMLAIFPALLAVAAVLGSLDSVAGRELAAQAENAILAALDRIFTDEAQGVLETVRGMFGEDRTGILTLGALGALFAAARGFVGVVRALDVAYDLDEHRSWFQLLPTAVVLALGSVVVAAVMLAMLVLGPVLGGGREVAGAIGLGDAFAIFWDVLRAPVAFVALVLWAATLYHRGPDHDTAWRRHLPGALLAATSWLVVSLGFRLYLRVAAEGNQVFGVLGGAMTLLVWLYLLGIGLLLGGELNAILAARRRR
ncbi:MAG TPA: YihY/virulence factor BrkB family protein [Acidimicrobiales bacterium]|nr:YihY/virulence factor BrkB family protein [Acidimicrobiales bacterium]